MAIERMLIWRGVSKLDGVTPIVALATGVPTANTRSRSSNNVKTGDMIQIHILVEDESPTEVLKQGRDAAVCGTCPHKSKAAGGSGACYTHGNIRRGWSQATTWKAHDAKGSVPFDAERFRGHRVRFGAYGDPAAVPLAVWQSIMAVADDFTGYTHQWRTCGLGYAEFCMASVDTEAEAAQAEALGYRTFFVREEGTAKPKGSIVCPASAEARTLRASKGQDVTVTCADCLQCSGNGRGRKAKMITIIAHGATKRAFAPLPLSVV